MIEEKEEGVECMQCPRAKDITELQKDVAVLQSKVDGVESDLDSIKEDIKAMRENNKEEFKAIRDSNSRIITSGLSATVLLLVGILTDIFLK